MFKLKYNIFVSIHVFFNLINYILLIKIFGISSKADAYYISVTILAALQSIMAMPIEQFMFFYNDYKKENRQKSSHFYFECFSLVLLIGIIAFVLLELLCIPIIKLFAFGIDLSRLAILKELMMINIIGLVVYPLYSLNDRFLNAEQKFSIPYILMGIPTFFVSMSLLGLFLTKSNYIQSLAWARTVGVILCALIETFIVLKILGKIEFRKPTKKLIDFIKNSTMTRIGYGIHDILAPMIINNVLVMFSTGAVSIYYLAKKIADTLNLVAIGPAERILSAKISELFPAKQIEKIKSLSKEFSSKSVIMFILAVSIIFIINPYLLKYLSSKNLTLDDINTVNFMFLALSGWLFIVWQERPYLFINIASKKSKYMIISNGMFIVLFPILIFLLKNSLNLFAIPASAIISQYVTYNFQKFFANRLIREAVNEQ
ncbi:MAG: lipid II flippase MurJ [Candidatus Gastranaerophilales bacterium]|nr:lipid II flippase MurJ [Candidatus Gastranaerophilales bacterium]